jgi:hypothetical protein
MTCIPCRVTFERVRYQIERDGTVRRMNTPEQQAEYKLPALEAIPPYEAKAVRAEAARQRRNRRSRERHDALRSLGLVKTPIYGWE